MNCFVDAFDAVACSIQGFFSECRAGTAEEFPAFNAYGDRRIIHTPYGADISVQRPDTLDKCCAQWVMNQNFVRENTSQVLDIGCGMGAQTLRLALLGANLVAVDVTDQGQERLFSQFALHFQRTVERGTATFVHADIRKILKQSPFVNEKPEIIYSQRMWSSIRYREALALLKDLNQDVACSPDAVFFVSAIGLDTELRKNYPHLNKPVQKRFSRFSPDMAKHHGVSMPHCLYTKVELIEQFRQAGLVVLRAWESSWGNPRVIAVRPAIKAATQRRLEKVFGFYGFEKP